MSRLKKNSKDRVTANLLGNIAWFQAYYGYNDERIRSIIGVGRTTFYTRQKEPETFKLKELLRLASSFNCSIADLLTIRRE